MFVSIRQANLTILLMAMLVLAGTGLAAQTGVWRHDAQASWSGRGGHSVAAFNNRLWVIGGLDYTYLSDIWSSPDGVTWTLEVPSAPFGGRFEHTMAVFNGRLWILGGFSGSGALSDVWSSPDGLNWSLEASNAGWDPRHYHTTEVFNNRIWIMGGTDGVSLFNDVWSSPDGINWTREVAAAAWSIRYTHKSTVFNNRLWVCGGSDFGNWHQDVWSSADGVNWTLETMTPAWWARGGHTLSVLNGRLWITGGSDGVNFNDAWSSADGVQWDLQTASAPWQWRAGHSAAVFNDRLWISGGYGLGSTFLHDVWSLGMPPEFTSAPPLVATAGIPYVYQISASGFPMPSIGASGLPSWLAAGLNQLSGTPTAADIGVTAPITVTATNTSGVATQVFQISVVGTAPRITTTPVTTVPANSAYSYAVQASGMPTPVLAATSLPPWLTFNAATGVLSGAPTMNDLGLSGLITISASNGTAPDAIQSFQLFVVEPPKITTIQKINKEEDSSCVASNGARLPVPGFVVALSALCTLACASRLRPGSTRQ